MVYSIYIDPDSYPQHATPHLITTNFSKVNELFLKYLNEESEHKPYRGGYGGRPYHIVYTHVKDGDKYVISIAHVLELSTKKIYQVKCQDYLSFDQIKLKDIGTEISCVSKTITNINW